MFVLFVSLCVCTYQNGCLLSDVFLFLLSCVPRWARGGAVWHCSFVHSFNLDAEYRDKVSASRGLWNVTYFCPLRTLIPVGSSPICTYHIINHRSSQAQQGISDQHHYFPPLTLQICIAHMTLIQLIHFIYFAIWVPLILKLLSF